MWLVIPITVIYAREALEPAYCKDLVHLPKKKNFGSPSFTRLN
jgi:hypothetical protein